MPLVPNALHLVNQVRQSIRHSRTHLAVRQSTLGVLWRKHWKRQLRLPRRSKPIQRRRRKQDGARIAEGSNCSCIQDRISFRANANATVGPSALVAVARTVRGSASNTNVRGSASNTNGRGRPLLPS